MKYSVVGPKLAILAMLVALGGCATTSEPSEPRVETVTVKVPVPVPCPALEELGPEPAYPDTDGALEQAETIGILAQLYRVGRALRVQRLAEYKAARAGCQALEQ